MGAIYGFTGPRDPALAEKMASVLSHRGGRSNVLHAESAATLGYLGRLEDDRRNRCAAGLHTDGQWSIALAGYLTHAPASRPRTLADLLHEFRTDGAASIVGWHGAFVAAICDGRTLHLIRDGAGIRTLYYARHDGRLLFAVEPKAVLAVPGFSRRLRPAALAQYLTYSFVPGEGTMLQDLHEIPAGHRLESPTGAPEPVTRRFFYFERPEPPDERADDEWVACFRRAFEEAVAERLPTKEPVGVFLSGGLDSSIVTAEVTRQFDGPVRTYAIHFGENYPHELEFARAVADRCGTEHEEVCVRPRDFLPRLRHIIWHLDEPIGDPITVPNFELASHVAGHVRWVFNGEGGDPCFGGPKNLPMLLHHWYGGVPRPPNFREQAYLASYRRGYEEVARLLAPDVLREVDVEADLESVLGPFFNCPRSTLFLDKLAAINVRLKGAHLILPKVDRMTAASGLIPLSPLFDETVLRLSFAMPARLRLDKGIEKVVLKRAYEADLPPHVVHRPKSGMRVPVHFWFRKELRRYARNVLSRRRVEAAGLFNPARVRQLLDYETEEGPGRYGLRLWMILTMELWRQIVLEGQAP